MEYNTFALNANKPYGVWVDGSTLYRSIITYNQSTQRVENNVASAAVYVGVDARIVDPASTMVIPAGFNNGSGAFFACAISGGKILTICSSHYVGYTVYVELIYKIV